MNDIGPNSRQTRNLVNRKPPMPQHCQKTILLCICILGGDSIRSFSFAMILGVVFGTLSSIFIASPMAYIVLGRKIKEEPAEEVAEVK